MKAEVISAYTFLTSLYEGGTAAGDCSLGMNEAEQPI